MKLITKEQVAVLFEVRPRTIEKWVQDGKFPKPLKIGKRVWWCEDELMTWLKQKLLAGLPD